MAKTTLPYPTIPSTFSPSSQDAIPQIRQPESMPYEVTIANNGQAVLGNFSSPGIYSVRIKATAACALFVVGVNSSTGAPTVALLAATDATVSGSVVTSAAFAIASAASHTSLLVSGTTGLLLENKSGGSLTYYVDRVV